MIICHECLLSVSKCLSILRVGSSSPLCHYKIIQAVVKCLVAGVIANAVNGRARGSFRCGVGGVGEVTMVTVAD